MEEEKLRAAIRRKTRLRLVFALVTLLLYFAFTLNYLPLGERLSQRIGDSWITGSLAMFVLLIVTFIVLEFVFLFVDTEDDPNAGGS
ncbi:MAG: hypothetical protein AAGI44_02890 [Pseudomonadota bacterium]